DVAVPVLRGLLDPDRLQDGHARDRHVEHDLVGEPVLLAVLLGDGDQARVVPGDQVGVAEVDEQSGLDEALELGAAERGCHIADLAAAHPAQCLRLVVGRGGDGLADRDPGVLALEVRDELVEDLLVLRAPVCERDFALGWSLGVRSLRRAGGGGGAGPAACRGEHGEPGCAGQGEQLAAVDGEAWIVLHWTTPSCSCVVGGQGWTAPSTTAARRRRRSTPLVRRSWATSAADSDAAHTARPARKPEAP